MNETDIRELYMEYNRQSTEAAREIAEIRKQARGILKNQAIAKVLRKEFGGADDDALAKTARSIVKDPEKYKVASEKQGIVLAYGMGERSYSLAELCEFLLALNKHKGKTGANPDIHGIPYSALLRASRPIDKERAKQVRNATYYQRRGNILYFNVTGNSRPFYRVQIRLEGWEAAILNTDPVFLAVQNVLAGRISIECPCGRHQYWYRYMASMGNYGLKPVETGFPKIRNRGLYGCCCKHVLKVLNELKSNRLLLLLSRELDGERKKSGFSNTPGIRMLSKEDLRLAEGKRLSAAAKLAFDKYKAEAENMKKKIMPRNGRGGVPLPKVGKAFLDQLEMFLKVGRDGAKVGLDDILDGFAKVNNMTREQIDGLVRKYNL